MNDENSLNILLEHNKKFDQSKYIVLSKLLKTMYNDKLMTSKDDVINHIQHELDILRFKLVKDH